MPERKKLPALTIERLCALYGELERMLSQGQEKTDSSELGHRTGIAAHTIRKDISLMADRAVGAGRTGYNVERLSQHIKNYLGIDKKKKACLVGLGRLGTALLDYRNFLDCEIVAGFDSSHNRIELLNTDIDLFPASRMEQVIKDKEITIGIVCVPAHAAQSVADTMVAAGIKGILNFAPTTLTVAENIEKIKIDFSNALRVITARMSQNNRK